jgi:glycosyltransferase involved in cell wall biosynthesis
MMPSELKDIQGQSITESENVLRTEVTSEQKRGVENERLRVLIYSDYFFPSTGGSENYCLDLATELSRQGHQVGVITATKADTESDFPFDVYQLSKPLSIKGLNINFLEIPNILKKFKPDVFHINYQSGGENFLILLLKMLHFPVILTYHADHVVPLGRTIDKMQAISTFRLVDKILVQTERDRNNFLSIGLNPSKLSLFRFNGIDTSKYRCDNFAERKLERCRVICVARLDDSHKYKGIGRLIEMAGQEKDLFSGDLISLILVGDGNKKVEYEKSVEKAGLKGVNFLGNLSNGDLISEICKSSFLILPSIDKAEGFGRVALEAISCGIPVAVSEFAGTSEIIKKYNSGLVFNPFSSQGIFSRILTITGDDLKIRTLTENGRQMIQEEKLRLVDTVKHTVEIYLQALSLRSRSEIKP